MHQTTRIASYGRLRGNLCQVCVPVLLAVAASSPVVAGPQQAAYPGYPHFKLIDLSLPGGTASMPIDLGVFLDNRGQVVAHAGTSALAPDAGLQDDGHIWHAILSDRTGSIRDLGALSDTEHSFPAGIAPNGLIAGASTLGFDPLTGFFAFRAVLWGHDLGILDLGTLGGNTIQATQVDSRGLVVGMGAIAAPEDPAVAEYFALAPAAQQIHAFVWQDGSMFDIGTLGGHDSAATFVNESGAVCGYSSIGTEINESTGMPTIHPFVWKNGQMQDLGSLGGTWAAPGSFALGPMGHTMNERGDVVGTSLLPGDKWPHAFLWSKGHMTDLGTLGGSLSEALAINDAGQVVGRARVSDDPVIRHAFVWERGKMTDLGTVGQCVRGTAVSINNKGQIVGGLGACTNDDSDPRFFKAFYVEVGKPMADLNALVEPASDIYLDDVKYINERGQILANGFGPDGQPHAVLLVPQPTR